MSTRSSTLFFLSSAFFFFSCSFFSYSFFFCSFFLTSTSLSSRSNSICLLSFYIWDSSFMHRSSASLFSSGNTLSVISGSSRSMLHLLQSLLSISSKNACRKRVTLLYSLSFLVLIKTQDFSVKSKMKVL